VRRRDGVRLATPGTPLDHGELVTGLRLPARPDAGAGWALRRLRTQGAADRPALTVALALDARAGDVAALRATAAFVGDRPLDLEALAPVVVGARPADVASGRLDDRLGDAALAAVDSAIAAGLVLHDDLRASAGYRRSMVAVLAVRAVRDATAVAARRP